MKGEESPDISKRNMERDLKFLQQITCTPKGKKIGLDDLHLLGLHRDCSPNAYGSSQDSLEIGWGDSPEPLKIEQKSRVITTPIACKKRLEARESPKSRCRNIRPSIRPPSKPPVDISKYIAEVQELSKQIMGDFRGDDGNEKGKENLRKFPSEDGLDFMNEDDLTNEYLIACSQSLESKLENVNKKQRIEKERKSFGGMESSKERKSFGGMESSKQLKSDGTKQECFNNDSAFEKVLHSFINEEDDWLSQAVLNLESDMAPRKNGFNKTKSDNNLSSPDNKGKITIARRSAGLAGNFRRTNSSDRVKSSSYNKVNNPRGRAGSRSKIF